MTASSLRTAVVVLGIILAITLPGMSTGHGVMTDPRQRGALHVQNRLVKDIDRNAPLDPSAHFPAGDKSKAPGAGRRSVIRAARHNWTPYEPLDGNFKWRAGVCGDEFGEKQEHLKGGKFFFPEENPTRVQEYKQGDIIDMEANVVVHHNGFFQFYICDADKCGNDISENCFADAHCQKLVRAPSFCDEGSSADCGPIDSSNPGRWYLPCGPFPEGQILYGGAKKGSMKYKLPNDLHCDHCVIQWYWTSANTCNPPGVVNYFKGPEAPRWPKCKGQGGAIGGYTSVQQECGGNKFPEEYWQCADVRIFPRQATASSFSTLGRLNSLHRRISDSRGNRNTGVRGGKDGGRPPQRNAESIPPSVVDLLARNFIEGALRNPVRATSAS